MKDKLKLLLKKLGLNAGQIDDVLADEPKYKPEELATTMQQTLREVLENDEDFNKSIHSRVRSEVLTSKEKKIMKLFGITQDEYDALPKETVFDSLLGLAHKKGTAAAGGKSDEEKDKEITRLNGEVGEYKTKLKKLEEEDIPAIRNSVASDKKTARIERKLLKLYNGNDPKRKLVLDTDLGVETIMRKVTERYDLDIDEATDTVVLLKKGTKLKAFEDNQKVTFEQVADKIAAEGRMLQVSNGKPPKTGKGAGADDEDDDNERKSNGRRVELPGLKKAKQFQKERMAAGVDDDDTDDGDDE